MSEPRLLTAEEVAEMIGMTTDYVYALSRRDNIPHLRFGRTLSYRPEAIDDWILAVERGKVAGSKKRGGAA